MESPDSEILLRRGDIVRLSQKRFLRQHRNGYRMDSRDSSTDTTTASSSRT